MRERALLAAVSVAVALACLAPSEAGAAFAQCPAVDHDTSCGFLITVTSKGAVQVAQDTTQPPYDGEDDTLVGIQNSSAKTIASIPLSAENGLFGFESDGLCSPGAEPIAPGCLVLPKNGAGEPTLNAGKPCPPETEACGFPPPAGEPAGLTFPPGISVNGFGANGDPVTGYEGPSSWFTGISETRSSGIVNFSPPIAPGSSAYFSLEAPPTGKSITVGTASALTTTLSGGGATGTKLKVVQGTPVTDTATLTGTAATTATGEVAYKVFKDPACTVLASEAGVGEVTAGVAKPSTAISKLAAGTYYWQATYSGDLNNQPAASACGTEVLTVVKKVNFNLPSSKQCVSKRHFIAHPRFPKRLKVVKVEVLINGVLKHTGRLHGTHTTIDLRGLPKGTFRVTMITTSITGQTFGDTRVFHTCVPRHRKHK